MIGCGAAAGPADVWPVRPNPASVLDATGIPVELEAAVSFQKTFLKILGGRPAEDWLGEMEFFATGTATDPVPKGLRELARVWLARAAMRRIDLALIGYYRQNVQFPGKLDGVDLPESLRRDPWGDPWSYQLHAPVGFGRLGAQRYQLGPARYPALSSLQEAIKQDFPARDWKITRVEIAGKPALKIDLASGTVATIEPGGMIGSCTLVYMGNNWALVASIDQLFVVPF